MKVSPHTHAESPLTGSTVKALVSKAKELGRTHFAYTDHGHLSSALKAQSFCKADKKAKTEHDKKAIKFIPGLEFYFKDQKCDIITGTPADRCRYFTATIYCRDQAAFQALSKHISQNTFPTTDIREEKQQLWSWADLEHMSKFNTELVLGGPHCMVGKTVLAGKPDLAEKILLKLKGLFGNRLSVAIVAEPYSKKWQQVVEIKYQDGTSQSMLASDLVTTNKARMMKARDLTERSGHFVVINTYSDKMLTEVNKKIASVKLHKGFLPLPGGDALWKINRFLLAIADRHGVFKIVSDYAYYANKEDKVVQTMRMEGTDKMHSNFYMKSEREVLDYLQGVLGLEQGKAQNLVFDTNAWAERFNELELKYNWRLVDTSESPIRTAMEIIRKNGRMKWDDPVWMARLKEEIEVIAKNPKKDLTGYFLPICDIMNYYAEKGELTGPARGSAGGSLFCYLLGITQLNPLKYDLSFPRFLSMDRLANGDIPDVDSDFASRELLVGKDSKSGYLYGKYGNRAAQISTRHTLRLKSTIKDTNRYFKGKVEPEIESLTDGLPDPPQGVTDSEFVFGYEDTDGNHTPGLIEVNEALQKYAAERPEEWDIVTKGMGITRAFSKHASAFVLSDVPISEVVPTKEGYITQYEAKHCEAAGLIKYDFLVVSNLKDIEVCLKLINKKNKEEKKIGYFTHQGKETYIWDLPEDLEAFKSVWGGNTETIFQINTKAMIPFVKEIKPETVEDISTILALVRPGPLDYVDPKTGRTMAEEYYWRRQGRSQPDLPELAALIPETYGIIVFQEQSLKISKELGGMLPSDAEKLRRFFAKKQKTDALAMKPVFMSTAVPKIGEEKATKIWDMMETSSRYSFNKSHSVAYAMISYAGIFLRHHYPLEWWAAVLTNADEKEITGKFWPYVKDLIMPPDINLSSDMMAVDYANKKLRSKLGIIRGLGEATIEPIVQGRPYKDIQDYVDKEVAGQSITHKLIHVNVLDSLFPPTANLAEKLVAYETALNVRNYRKKVEKAASEGRTFRGAPAADGQVPEKYTNLHPIVDAVMRKSVLPSMPIDTTSLGAQFSKVAVPNLHRPIVMSANGHETPLVTGATLERLDLTPPDKVTQNIYVAATCFVLEAKKFDFSNNTKTALKMILDCDGYVSEKVLWPHIETGELIYPPELKKGALATFFFKKRIGKKDMSIMSVVVEG